MRARGTAITLSTVVDQYITIAGVLGATTASNTLTLTTLKLYGCN